ncbi:MAG: hypothetical protein Q9P14_10975 [candidate division KSB1 bacterium]|nr:hypothetical protein [candidate division KSB1 bacterium]MDQ7063949.1 hypothetical protein [candidate division KSB1 bacterium]
METSILSVLAFLILLSLLVTLRIKTGNKIEVKSADILLALIPVALWLFLTGKIQEFAFGDLKIVAAIREASESPVAKEVTTLISLPVENVRVAPKGRIENIPDLLEKRTQVLAFRLGYGGYQGSVIQRYLEMLTRQPYLRYIVIENPDGTFFGLADARQLATLVRSPARPFSVYQLADWLNAGEAEPLERLPGFVSSQQALTQKADRRKALEIMNALDVQVLPVVNESRRFVGIVDRSKLTASMLIDIAARLEGKERE